MGTKLLDNGLAYAHISSHDRRKLVQLLDGRLRHERNRDSFKSESREDF